MFERYIDEIIAVTARAFVEIGDTYIVTDKLRGKINSILEEVVSIKSPVNKKEE